MNIKIITLNIEHGGKLLDDAISFLNEQDPDILFLQESQETDQVTTKLHYKTVTEVTKRTQLPYHVFSPFCEFVFGEVRIFHGNAVFSKYPLTFLETVYFVGSYETADFFGAQERHDYSELPHAMQITSVQLPHCTVQLLNVHGVWGRDGEDSEIRDAMVDKIIRKIDPTHPTIAAGDFNFQAYTHAARRLEEQLHSVFGQTLTSTFNMRRKTDPGFATASVDMIYVSKNVPVLSSACPQVEVSDHLPLVCELEL